MPGPGGRDPAPPGQRLRIDKWLWQARFFRSRSLAAAAVETGHIRVNGQPVSRPGREIAPGDTLTLPQGGRIRLIRVTALGHRRGPAPEAQALYLDLDASPEAGPEAGPEAAPEAAPGAVPPPVTPSPLE